VRRFLAVLFFLMLVSDGPARSGQYITIYGESLWTPTLWVQGVLFEPLLVVRPFDILMAIALMVGLNAPDGKGPRVRPMRSTLLLAVATTLFWVVLGVLRGGDGRSASWQVYLILAAILASFALAANFRTPEHFLGLAKAYVAAAFYRAFMGIVFYIGWVRSMAFEDKPPYLTTHDDTVLWVAAIMLLIVNAAEMRTRRAIKLAGWGIPFLMIAIQLNNRRLAWVSLGAALVTFYALLRLSAVKKRITRTLLLMVPVILTYVVVGWGRGGRLFKPLAAFASVSTVEDPSTKARNVENLGLIATANTHGWLTGSGFGHKYVELTNKYSIATAFELWPYIPHNSILGIFAFTGFLGFAGTWLRMPTAAFLLARTARLARRPIERAIGVSGVTMMVVCFNQLFGDMGIFSMTTMYSLALVWAAALRIPIEAKVWGAARSPSPSQPRG
jgi:hypothetical protein